MPSLEPPPSSRSHPKTPKELHVPLSYVLWKSPINKGSISLTNGYTQPPPSVLPSHSISTASQPASILLHISFFQSVSRSSTLPSSALDASTLLRWIWKLASGFSKLKSLINPRPQPNHLKPEMSSSSCSSNSQIKSKPYPPHSLYSYKDRQAKDCIPLPKTESGKH